jgi:SAM-dependent methyltransferase
MGHARGSAGGDRGAASSWDAAYQDGRYRADPPVPFVADIIDAAGRHGLAGAHGLYVGCGNGRNFLPLARHGLRLTGLDVSAVALRQLAERAPEYRDRLVHGDLSALPRESAFDIIIGIQVFQHGDREAAHAAIRQAAGRLRPGGLFCLRVNAAGTDLWPEHDVTQRHADGGLTIRYLAGAKAGLLIHFFSAPELTALFAGLRPVLPLRLCQTRRTPPEPGQWSQWEGIWHKAGSRPQ